jgi:hypothetical protein
MYSVTGRLPEVRYSKVNTARQDQSLRWKRKIRLAPEKKMKIKTNKNNGLKILP